MAQNTPQIADKMKLKKIINIVCIAIMIGSMMGMVYAEAPVIENVTLKPIGSMIENFTFEFKQLTYREIVPEIKECYQLSGKEIGYCFREIRSRFDYRTGRYREKGYKWNMNLSVENVTMYYYWNSSVTDFYIVNGSDNIQLPADVVKGPGTNYSRTEAYDDGLSVYEEFKNNYSELGEEEFIPKENCSVDIAKKYNLTDKEWRELLYMMAETSQNRIIEREYIRKFSDKSLESYIEILEECHNIK